MDILREVMMDSIEKKILDFRTEKEVYEYNETQLSFILSKLKRGEELNQVENAYLEIIFDQ